jgi:hypothetical protein
LSMCNPLESKNLILEMESGVPSDVCSHCFPDCNQVVYQKSITNQQFRKCDEKILVWAKCAIWKTLVC